MKTLLLMRHAKSSWDNPKLADHERPLNNRGKNDAPKMGEHLNQEDLIPDVILCSSAKRARQTVEGVLETLSFDGEVKIIDDLYHSGPRTYLELLSGLSEDIERAMLVGHNPEMDYFLEYVCDVYEHMTTANIAVIEFTVDGWRELVDGIEGKLVDLWRPKEI